MGKQEIEAAVERVARQAADAAGVELVDVEYRRGKESWVRIYIYSPEGVTLDHCEAVSRRVGEYLDEADLIPHSYQLEVSSPGLERVLRNLREYRLFAGRQVEVRCRSAVDGQRVWRGRLLGHEAGQVRLETVEGRRLEIPFEQVARAQLVFTTERP